MKKIFFYFRLVISVLLIVFFISRIDISQSFKPMGPSGWFYIVITVLVANLDRVLMSYKWNILLKAKGIALPFTEVVRSYFIGTFWGLVLPTSVGGDIVRGYRVSRQGSRVENIVASIVLERVLGVISLFLMSLLSLVLFALLISSGSWKLAGSVILSLLFFSLLAFVSFNSDFSQWCDRRFQSSKQRWIGMVVRVYRSYQAYRSHRGAMLRFLLWSLVEQWVPILCAFFVSRALNLAVPLWAFVIFIPLIFSVSRMPVSIQGFGVREGLYIYCFSFVGVVEADAFVLGLLSHVVGMVAVLPGFFYYSLGSRPPLVADESMSG